MGANSGARQADVIIVGGGIAGAAAAYYLGEAQIGAEMFERESVGAHASGFAFGVLPPSTYSAEYGAELNCRARDEHLRLSEFLAQDAGVDYHFRERTHAELALTSERAAELRALQAAAKPSHPRETVDWLDGAEFRAAEPLASDRIVAALTLGGNYEIDPLLFTQALWQAARKKGATLTNQAVVKILFDGDRAIGAELQNGDRRYADLVILANGAWITQFIDAPVVPLRGQILRVRAGAVRLRHVCFWGKNDYASSKPNGLDYIGSTEELLDELDPSPTEAARQKMLNSTRDAFPALAQSELVQHTACLRPATPDRLPIVGKLAAYRNLAVIGGAGRNGILQSPFIARILAANIAADKTHPQLDELKPERFN